MRKYQILIAHQSTIPHYRVEFYQALQNLLPDKYEFTVVFDESESERIFFTKTNNKFSFNTYKAKTTNFKLLSRKIQLQTFPLNIWKYDLIILGSAIGNLSYPFAFLMKLMGKKIAIWGKGKDYEKKYDDAINTFSENSKILLAKLADGFFAYTSDVARYLVSKGVKAEKVFTINNTINTVKHRDYYNHLVQQRDRLRLDNELQDKKVLLYVGRLIGNKKIDFLLDTFDTLVDMDKDYRLIIIGSGEKRIIDEIEGSKNNDKIYIKGFVPDEEIGTFFVMSDLYIYPGVVGLGPLHALCYNLIPAVIHSDRHSAEYEYLNNSNALIIPQGTDAKIYATGIYNFMKNKSAFNLLRSNAFSTVQHLTLDNMAGNYVRGIEYILK